TRNAVRPFLVFNNLTVRRLSTSVSRNCDSTNPLMAISLSPWKKSRPNPPLDKKHSRSERGRKVPVRPHPGGDTGRTVAASRELSSLARVVHTLREEKFGFK